MALQLSATSSVFVQLQQNHQQLLQQEHYLVYPEYQQLQQQLQQQQHMTATAQPVSDGVLLLLYSSMAPPSVFLALQMRRMERPQHQHQRLHYEQRNCGGSSSNYRRCPPSVYEEAQAPDALSKKLLRIQITAAAAGAAQPS
ncbi:hypothetical protein Efla_006878 [Eimeria flavescens]